MSSLSRTPRTLWVVLLGTLGFLAGITLINFRATENPCSASFTEIPQFSVWYCLVGFETAIWSILSIPLWKRLQQFNSHLQKHWLEILLTILLVTFLVVLMFDGAAQFVDELQVPLYGFRRKTELLNAIGLILVLLAGSGMWLVQIALQDLILKENQSNNQKISSFLDLRDTLQNFLLTAGTIVGAATLATGALRQTILNWYSASSSIISVSCERTASVSYSPETVLLYGIYLSGILALAYLPTYRTLIAVGHKLCDKLSPMPNFHDAEWAAWITKRKALEEMLKLNLSVKQSFETSVAIFTPLVTSSISFLLEKK